MSDAIAGVAWSEVPCDPAAADCTGTAVLTGAPVAAADEVASMPEVGVAVPDPFVDAVAEAAAPPLVAVDTDAADTMASADAADTVGVAATGNAVAPGPLGVVCSVDVVADSAADATGDADGVPGNGTTSGVGVAADSAESGLASSVGV